MRTSRAVRKDGDQEEDPKWRLLPHPLLTLIALASHRRLSHSKFPSLRLTPLYTSCIHRQDITSYPRRSPPSKCTRLPPVDDSSTPSLLSRVVSRHPSTCTRPRSLLFFAGGRHRPVCRSEPSQLEGAGEDIYCEQLACPPCAYAPADTSQRDSGCPVSGPMRRVSAGHRGGRPWGGDMSHSWSLRTCK
jgi:hypothetical protein